MKHVFQSTELQSHTGSSGGLLLLLPLSCHKCHYSPLIPCQNKRKRTSSTIFMPSTIFSFTTVGRSPSQYRSFTHVNLILHSALSILSSLTSPATNPSTFHHLMPNLPTSQTPNNHPTELGNRIDKTSQDTCDAVHDGHDAVADSAEGGDELLICQYEPLFPIFPRLTVEVGARGRGRRGLMDEGGVRGRALSFLRIRDSGSQSSSSHL